jgi:hypothetical protein
MGPKDLVLLLKKTDPLLCLPQLGGFLLGDAGTDDVLDVGFLQPVMQSGFGNPEFLGDLRQRGFMLPSDRNDISAELGGVRLGHRNILPARTESSQVMNAAASSS